MNCPLCGNELNYAGLHEAECSWPWCEIYAKSGYSDECPPWHYPLSNMPKEVQGPVRAVRSQIYSFNVGNPARAQLWEVVKALVLGGVSGPAQSAWKDEPATRWVDGGL